MVDGLSVVIASGPEGDPPNAIDFAYNVILAKPETCQKRRPVCIGMGQVMKEAVAYMHSNPVGGPRDPGQEVSQPRAKADRSGVRGNPEPTLNMPDRTKQSLKNADDFNVEAGMMKADAKLKSYDGLYTDEFVK